jgi:hypothetical protein
MHVLNHTKISNGMANIAYSDQSRNMSLFVVNFFYVSNFKVHLINVPIWLVDQVGPYIKNDTHDTLKSTNINKL